MKRNCSILFLAFLAAGHSHTRVAIAASPDSEIIDVDICTLETKALSFHHKLVRVTGFVARDFETFWIDGDNCPKNVWPLDLVYGGTTPADDTVGNGTLTHSPDRRRPLRMDGIELPLESNSLFRRFDSLTKSLKIQHLAKATLVGRVFSKPTYTDDTGKEHKLGDGMSGLPRRLFVIQRVERVSRK